MGSPATSDQYEKALSLFDSGDFQASHDLAVRGLGERPQDVSLLRLAGRAGVESDAAGASGYLEQAVELEPENPDAWGELGDALLYEGRLAEATKAFHRAVELRPDDVSTLVHLAHATYAGGDAEGASGYIAQAVERDPENAATRRALVDIYRGSGRLEEAVATAAQLSETSPDDVLAALDVAELSLALHRPEAASAAFSRLRTVDDDPEHEIYAYHGMIQAEIQQDQWRRALDLAIEATRVDRYGRTTDVLAYIVTQVFGQADRPAPTRAEVDEALAASQVEHRRLHEESLGL